MKKTPYFIAVFVFILLLVPAVSAASKQYHTVLLAVEDRAAGLRGSVADLTLELREGTGRVFIDTYPLTKFDTQISTRFAKEIACDYLDADCKVYDFIYTIKADSTLVGGPSAGAATTLLTLGALQGKELDKNIAITGTINSGGFIGPVGGIKQKIEGAHQAGLTTVIIPKGRRFATDELSNITCTEQNCSLNQTGKQIDLVTYGKSIGITVVEAGNIETAWSMFTGAPLSNQSTELPISGTYSSTMKQLAETLCERTKNLSSAIIKDGGINQSANESIILLDIQNFTERSQSSFKEGDYYSSASFCFGANVKAREVMYRQKKMNNKEILKEINRLYDEIITVETEISQREKETITDLETYMIVKERLLEAKETLNETFQHLKNKEDAFPSLAYSAERYYSALSWSHFFGLEGRTFTLDEQALKESCLKKISEVEERYQYVSLFIPQVGLQRKEIDRAQENQKKGDFELCLFQASKAKAEVDVVLSAYGTEPDHIQELIQEKRIISQRHLAKEIQKGIFPILGYSYYEYGSVLGETDPYSALLYLEYALELSSLDIYFEDTSTTEKQTSSAEQIISSVIPESALLMWLLIMFGVGLILGLSVGMKIKQPPKQAPLSMNHIATKRKKRVKK